MKNNNVYFLKCFNKLGDCVSGVSDGLPDDCFEFETFGDAEEKASEIIVDYGFVEVTFGEHTISIMSSYPTNKAYECRCAEIRKSAYAWS